MTDDDDGDDHQQQQHEEEEDNPNNILIPSYVSDTAISPLNDNDLCYPPEYEGHFDGILLHSNRIQQRIKELATLIHADYKGQRPVLICTLKGACPFFVHLCDALQQLRQGYDVEFVRVSSYIGATTSGNVEIMGGKLQVVVQSSICNRHVLVIEDIVDTGTTLSTLIPLLLSSSSSERKQQQQQQEKSDTTTPPLPPPLTVQVCTLLDKRLGGGGGEEQIQLQQQKKKYKAKYCGFSIPNKFVIGYGLDYNELYRDLKDIFVISNKGIDYDSKQLHT